MVLLSFLFIACGPARPPAPPLALADTGTTPTTPTEPDGGRPGFDVIPYTPVTPPSTPPVTGSTDEPEVADHDGDGAPDAADCAPDDPAVHPSANELCGPRDEDCDGRDWAVCTSGVADSRLWKDVPFFDTVASLGDLDADGQADLLFTADPSKADPGTPVARVVLGARIALGQVPIDHDDPGVAAASRDVAVAPAGDVDGDGRPELLVVGTRASGEQGLGLLHAWDLDQPVNLLDEASTWRSDLDVDATVRQSLRRAGDVDGDGVPDVGWTVDEGDGETTVRVLSGRSLLDGTTQVATLRGDGGIAAEGRGDVDGDGLDDLVSYGGADCGVDAAGCVRLYRGARLGTWDELEEADRSWAPHGSGEGRAWIGGDTDGDGQVDVVAVHTIGTNADAVWSIRSLPDAASDGTGSFGDAALYVEGPTDAKAGGGAWSSDYDGDGRADLAISVVYWWYDTVLIYLGASLPPSGAYDASAADASIRMAIPSLPADPVDMNDDGRDDFVAAQSADGDPAVIFAWLFTPAGR